MSHWQFQPPARLIKIKAVLFESCQIEDTEIRAARRDIYFPELLQFFFHPAFCLCVGEIQQTGGIVVVGRRFTQVIKTGPDKFTGSIRKFIQPLEFCIRWKSPGRGIKIIGAYLEITSAMSLVFADREKILAARAYTGRGFTAKNWNIRIPLMKRAVFGRL
jgi:hypothetical protein